MNEGIGAQGSYSFYFFLFFSAISVVGALGVVLFRNLLHAALALLVTFLGVAGLFVILNAEFLAAVQVMIYAGAIIILVLFAILVSQNIMKRDIIQTNRAGLIGILSAITVAWIFISVFWSVEWDFSSAAVGATDPRLRFVPTVYHLGVSLMATYTLPFEIAGLILLFTLMGCLVIARKD